MIKTQTTSPFSISKILSAEQDTLKRARIKIVVTILFLSLLKLILLIPISIIHDQKLQLIRGVILLVAMSILTILLLAKPSRVVYISHLLLCSGLLVIWSNLVLLHSQINVSVVQTAMMVLLCSYYLFNHKQAIMYSLLAVFPIMLALFTKHSSFWKFTDDPQQLASPGYELVVLINFITIIFSHYLFYRTFHSNLLEKETLNEQLQLNLKNTSALAESRSVFLSTMSHELRTPLNAVIGMSNLLKDTATTEQKENVEILEFSALGLMSLINDILDYNKTESQQIELEQIPVNIHDLVTKVAAGMHFKAEENGLHLELDIDEVLKDQWVTSDPTRLMQIIYNLAGNAIKFTAKGKVWITIQVMEHTQNNINIHFTVGDTGIGIPAERQQAIFDPFTQASTDTTRHYGGTGLGLAIVKRLLSLFKSQIHLESKPGEGSVFSFAIDFKPAVAKTALLNPESLMLNLKNLRILIVEDNRVNAILLEKILSRWNIHTTWAKDGNEGIHALLNHPFDVILMDLHMPVMDGFEATAAIRALNDPYKAQIPIVALTASVSADVKIQILEAGMQTYMSKPFQPEQLYELLNTLPLKTLRNKAEV